jgi:zinc transport system permease protein
VLIGDRIAQEAHDVAGILFGTAVLVDPTDLMLVLGVGGIALTAALVLHRGIVYAGYDPDGARVQGLPVRGLEMGLVIVVTLVVSVATRALGALPVFAFSVLPGVAALLASPRLGPVFPIAAALGALSGGLGYIAAFLWEFPVASQTAVAVAFVVLAVPLRLLRR